MSIREPVRVMILSDSRFLRLDLSSAQKYSSQVKFRNAGPEVVVLSQQQW